ncbi:MAG: hypothetical protein ABIQ16_02465 [Polyangiaceae bacterium]
MSSVVRLSQHRSVARRDLPLSIGGGDSDLVPVAVVLWLATLARVVLAVLHREVFGAEATLALLCAVVLPWFMVKARNLGDTVRK